MQAVYEDLGINTGALGCVKLKVAAAPVTVEDVGGEAALYVSSSPLRPWVKGFINKGASHVTLTYGLLPGVEGRHVRTALSGWSAPAEVAIKGISVFPSPVPEEDPYVCLVASLETDEDAATGLKRANYALQALPHISRYPEFKAHVTLAYIHRDHFSPELVEKLRALVEKKRLAVLECVYEPAGTKI